MPSSRQTIDVNNESYFVLIKMRLITHDKKVNRKESPGKEVEVVWACDEMRGALRRKDGDGNESTGEKEERKT